MRQPAMLWLVCLAAVTALARPAGQQQFRASIDVVHLPVVVTGRAGGVVTGLSASDFTVFEDGRPQAITSFAAGAPGDALPLYLGLLLDSSTSMDRDLKVAANAAVRFIDALEEAVDVTFIDFDTSVRLGRFSPPSYPHLFARIRSGRAEGYTALYDALAVYLQSAMTRAGQHVVLLHTDGGDSASRMSISQLHDLLRMGNSIVYVVGYLEHQPGSARVAQQMRMSQIARETGGDAFFPGSARDIDEAYAKILAEVAGRYTIGYVSPKTTEDGQFRKVEVKLTRTDIRGAKVRTRTGYRR
jgi:Ca-activated chloride channel family protein